MLLNESTIVISNRERTIAIHDRHNLTRVAILCMITEGKSAFPPFPFSFPLSLISPFCVAGIGMEGEILVIHNISRYCDGVYQCLASNDVPPNVEMETTVIVECKSSTTPYRPQS